MSEQRIGGSDNVDIIVDGAELSIEVLKANRHQLALAYLRRIRGTHHVADETPLVLECPALPLNEEPMPILRLTSNEANNATLAIISGDGTSASFELSVEGIRDLSNGFDDVQAHTMVRDALFDLRIRSESDT